MINPNDIAEKTFEKATFGYKSRMLTNIFSVFQKFLQI